MILLRKIFFAFPFLLTIVSLYLFISWFSDTEKLEELAVAVTSSCKTDADRIIKLNEWVYNIKTKPERPRFFLYKSFRPTPVQVIRNGGDCAEKSRLLSAMLKQIGISSTLAMLYPCENCPSGHTIVEAKYEDGWMAVDPLYNIVFPDTNGGYHDIKKLGSNHQLLVNRINELRLIRGPKDNINYYNTDEDNYLSTKTINWNKNIFTRAVSFFVSFFSDDPFLVRRPHFLEDPKLFLAMMCSGIGLLFFSFYIVFRLFSKRSYSHLSLS